MSWTFTADKNFIMEDLQGRGVNLTKGDSVTFYESPVYPLPDTLKCALDHLMSGDLYVRNKDLFIKGADKLLEDVRRTLMTTAPTEAAEAVVEVMKEWMLRWL